MNSGKVCSMPAVFGAIGSVRAGRLSCFLLLLLILVGCDQLSRQKVENPVIGAPPPRVGLAQIEGESDPPGLGTSGTDVLPIPLISSDSQSLEDYPGTQVVALVNGAPILASEVLEPYARNLARAREAVEEEKITLAQFESLQNQLLKKDLNAHIERNLLIEALRSRLPPEGLKKLEEDNDQVFEGEIERLKKELKVETLADLETELQKQGTTLERLRDNFANQRMAYGYLSTMAKSNPVFSRRDLYDHYQAHLEDFAIPAQVRWQQIVVYFQQHGGRSGSLAVLKQAVEELKKGTSFSAVATRYSDGPRAQDGGQWDWTRTGSLSDKTIEQELFELPVGRISRVIEGVGSFHLVKVNDRQTASHKPFAEVQKKIRSSLETQAKREASLKILEDLRATAVIETIFDGEKKDPGRTAAR